MFKKIPSKKEIISIFTLVILLAFIIMLILSFLGSKNDLKYKCVTLDGKEVMCHEISKFGSNFIGLQKDGSIIVIKEYKIIE